MKLFQQIKKKITSDENDVFNSSISSFMGLPPPSPASPKLTSAPTQPPATTEATAVAKPITPLKSQQNVASSPKTNSASKLNKSTKSTNNSSPSSKSLSSSSSRKHHHHHHHHHQNKKAVPHFKLVSAQISDSLFSIATKFNMSEEDLMIINRLSSRCLYPGQIIMTCLNYNINTIIRPIAYSNFKGTISLNSKLGLSSSIDSAASGTTATTVATSGSNSIDLDKSNGSLRSSTSSNSSLFQQMHQQLQPPEIPAHDEQQLQIIQQREQYKILFESIKQSFDSLTQLNSNTPTTPPTPTTVNSNQQQQPIDIITSYKLFLPAMRERNDWYLSRPYENEKDQQYGSLDLSQSVHTQVFLMNDSLLTFKNVIYFLEMGRMQVQLHGVIEINKEFLTFAPISSNYSFNRISFELSDILSWKFDSYHKDHLSLNIDLSGNRNNNNNSNIKASTSVDSNMITVFKIWVKYEDDEEESSSDESSSDEENSVFKYFNGISNSKSSMTFSTISDRSDSKLDDHDLADDENEDDANHSNDDDDDDDDDDDFEEKIFIIDKTDIDISNYEAILTGILGPPINSFYQSSPTISGQNKEKTVNPSPDLSKSPLTAGSTTASKETEHPLLAKTNYLLLEKSSPDSSSSTNVVSTSPSSQTSGFATLSSSDSSVPPSPQKPPLPQYGSSKILTLRNNVKPREAEIFKKEIHCIFNTRKVKGILTLLPHWVIFQADPKDEFVKKEGSIRFQLNYTMNQVISCTMEEGNNSGNKSLASSLLIKPTTLSLLDETTLIPSPVLEGTETKETITETSSSKPVVQQTETSAGSLEAAILNTLKESSGDLQFGMESDTSSHGNLASDNEDLSSHSNQTTSTTSTTSAINTTTAIVSASPPSPSPTLLDNVPVPPSPSATASTTAALSSSPSSSAPSIISNVYITIQITPTIEKTIQFQCELEIAKSICSQLNIWMEDVKDKLQEFNNIGSTMILDNILPLPPLIKPNSPSGFAKTLFRWNRSEFETSEEEDTSDEYDDIFIPKLFGQSTLITPDETLQIINDLPVLYKLSDWVLLYSTERDGISMKTMYTKTQEQGACIILIKDFDNHIFGGFISESLKLSKSFYGTGECFLMKLKPSYKSFKWTRENRCFALTAHNFISMGAGFDGKYGLWLDAEFNEGTSSKCETFSNDPLASKEDFKCVSFEIWGFL